MAEEPGKIINMMLTREEKIDDLISMHDDIKSMIELQKQVLGTMHIIFMIGNAFKWIMGIAGSVYGVYYLIKTGNYVNKD